MTSQKPPRPLHVTVVSDNAETRDGLQAYFDRSGVEAHGTRVICAPGGIGPTTTAVVLFPDDFDHSGVIALIAELRRTRPRLLLLIITREPHRFEAAVAPTGRSVLPLILPRPSFGWTILDAIRSHGRPDTC